VWGEGQAALANRTIDDRIIDLCHRRRCPLIYTSSTSVYGLRVQGVVTEEDNLGPLGEYALAKATSEMKMLSALRAGAIVLRVSSPYGPGQRTRNVLRIFIERALADLDLVFYGSGNRQQDFVSAYDVANAVVCAVLRMSSSGIFNIASGVPVSMRDLAELVIRTVPGTGSRIISSGIPDPQENQRTAFSISKAQAILGWRPVVSLMDGIKSWAQYLKEHS
jgi:UDP-glucose 4-epimerase